ncbi:MAG: AMP-binding protein, partial [Clostridia bacterium]|nr:AMP-binding protein [Clostridia bacterium]
MSFKNRKKNYPHYETTYFQNFREMTENVAERYPDRVAFRYKTDPHQKVAESITFAECRDVVRALATELHAMNVKGKKIAIIGSASVDWFLSYTAIMSVGAVTVPIDRELPVTDVASIIATAGCETVFFSADLAPKIAELCHEAPALTTLIAMGGAAEGATPVADLVAAGREKLAAGDRSYFDYEIDEEALASIVFTSGTTGKGKGVMLSLRNIC